MYILVSYDVSTLTPAGAARLRKVAKTCENYGLRVQKSIFECKVEPADYIELKNKLCKLMDFDVDSLRIYRLGKNWEKKIEHIGTKKILNIDKPLIV